MTQFPEQSEILISHKSATLPTTNNDNKRETRHRQQERGGDRIEFRLRFISGCVEIGSESNFSSISFFLSLATQQKLIVTDVQIFFDCLPFCCSRINLLKLRFPRAIARAQDSAAVSFGFHPLSTVKHSSQLKFKDSDKIRSLLSGKHVPVHEINIVQVSDLCW